MMPGSLGFPCMVCYLFDKLVIKVRYAIVRIINLATRSFTMHDCTVFPEDV